MVAGTVPTVPTYLLTFKFKFSRCRAIRRPRLHDADLLRRASSWLLDVDHAELVAVQAASTASALLESVNSKEVARLLLDFGKRSHSARPFSPTAGELLGIVLEEGAHIPAVLLALH